MAAWGGTLDAVRPFMLPFPKGQGYPKGALLRKNFYTTQGMVPRGPPWLVGRGGGVVFTVGIEDGKGWLDGHKVTRDRWHGI